VAAAGPQTWYDLASLTKPLVVATLCEIAFTQGRLAPETWVGEVLPGAENRPLGRATVGQLLSHASGLPAWRPLYALASTPAQVVPAILELELEAPPGERVLYSCLDFIVLGRVLERVFRRPLAACFDELVVRPLGLAGRLGFLPNPADRPLAGGAGRPIAEWRMTSELGHDPRVVPPVAPGLPDDGNARFLGGVAGNAGLFGTAEGVWRLATEWLPGQGRLLDPAGVARATSRVAGGPGDVRGFGWQLAASAGCSAGSSLDAAAFGHTGFTGTSLWVDPGRRAVLVLLANRHHPGHRDVDLHPLRRRFHALAVRELDRA
jgi:CubicO group peptidase (beta-lactamase class C family)